MKTIQQMREAMKAKHKEARAIMDEHQDNWTDEHSTKFDSLMADMEAIQANIDRELKLQGLDDLPGADATSIAAQSTQHIEVAAKPVYRNVGEQMIDIVSMTRDTIDAPKARERFNKVVNATGMSTGVDSEGGYLIETDKSKEIITTAVETGVLSGRCTDQPIGPGSDSFEYFTSKDRDRSAGTFLGGVKVYRKGETTTMANYVTTEIEPRETKVEDVYALLAVTNRMLRDNVALTGMVRNVIPKAFAFQLDKEIWEGSGVGQCLGIMNSDVLVSVPKVTDQTADTIVAQNLVDMLIRFYGNLGNAAWFVNQDTLGQFPMMTIGDQPIFIPGGSFSNAPYGVLLGRPIVPIEHSETLGDKGDIMLADFSQYLVVKKGATEEAESIHVKFLTDEKVFRWIKRNNGQPIHDSAVTPLKGSSTLSPFVTLAARA